MSIRKEKQVPSIIGIETLFIVSDYINIASEDIPLEASRDFVVINDNDVTNIKTQDVLVFEITKTQNF